MFTSINAKISKSCLNLAKKQTTFLWLCKSRSMISVPGPMINWPAWNIPKYSIMLSTSKIQSWSVLTSPCWLWYNHNSHLCLFILSLQRLNLNFLNFSENGARKTLSVIEKSKVLNNVRMELGGNRLQ